MGEQPDCVFNVGAPGLEHVARSQLLPHDALIKELGIPLQKPYFLVTYHPVTLSEDDLADEFSALLQVLDEYPNHHVLFTYPNADHGGQVIIDLLERYCQAHSTRAFVMKSLGYRRYLSAMAGASAVIGNSSSGIIEVPAFGLPTVNIGIRQQGRLCADSVIHAQSEVSSIRCAIEKAVSPETQARCVGVHNPYGQGDVAAQIIAVLKTCKLSTMKQFYDWDEHHASI